MRGGPRAEAHLVRYGEIWGDMGPRAEAHLVRVRDRVRGRVRVRVRVTG